MATRRVVIGKYDDGVNYGLRVSLSGYDALTDDSSQGTFSFDSNWTDVVKTLQMGIFTTPPFHQDPTTGLIIWDGPTSIPFTDLGYIPYVEVRQISGSTINDDLLSLPPSAAGYGIGAAVVRGAINPSPSFTRYTMIYIIFKIPVASQ